MENNLQTKTQNHCEYYSQVNKELNQIFCKFEFVYSYFCYMTGALVDMKEISKVLDSRIKTKEYVSDEIHNELDSSLLVQNQYKKLKKYQAQITESLLWLKNSFYLFLNNKEMVDLLKSMPDLEMKNQFQIQNENFSSSCMLTIDNCLLKLAKLFKKNQRIFYLLIREEEKTSIINKIYGKDVSIKDALIFNIYEDQRCFEEIILIINYIMTLSNEDFFLWLKKTLMFNKKN